MIEIFDKAAFIRLSVGEVFAEIGGCAVWSVRRAPGELEIWAGRLHIIAARAKVRAKHAAA